MEHHRRTLLLTGASRGIGHATVKRFASAGWRVLTVSRHAFPEECPWEGGERDHVQLDLSDIETMPAAVEDIRGRLEGGLLHALVNNAAISPKGEAGSRLGALETDAALLQHVFRVNTFATALLARALFPELRSAQGSIVNVTSIAGSRVHPFAGMAYACSKAALAALTREMAHDFGRYGVRVNAIAPGEINNLHPVPWHRGDRAERDPDAPPGHPGGGGGDDFLPLHRCVVLHQRGGNPHQRRPARLTRPRCAAPPALAPSPNPLPEGEGFLLPLPQGEGRGEGFCLTG